MPALPAARPDVEASISSIPGYYLSTTVQENPTGRGVTQAAISFEPDRLIGVKGLVAGVRFVGDEDTGQYFEPLLGYRAFVDTEKRVAAGAFAYGTHGSGSRDGAEYSLTRGGGEAVIDFRVTPESHYAELHMLGAISFTALSAEGTYCLDAQGRYGVECPDPPMATTTASAGGFYPTGVIGLALDGGRHLDSAFHGARLGLTVGAGRMPRVIGGDQEDGRVYTAAGLGISVALGATE